MQATEKIIGLAAFDDNYIWLLRGREAVVVVDPGDAEPVLRHLAASGLRLAAILLTHHHGDHQDGVAELVRQSGETLPVYGPALEAIPGVTHALEGGERIFIESVGTEFEVISVPGHTRGHLAYYAADCKALFCGDTLFGGGCGRLFEGTAAQMQASLAKIAVLPAPTLVYCAHEYTERNLLFARAVEPENTELLARCAAVAKAREARLPTVPSTLALELATNPFLRWDAPDVIAAARRRLGKNPQLPAETFAAIREWRNEY